jgi:hypothetical protein
MSGHEECGGCHRQCDDEECDRKCGDCGSMLCGICELGVDSARCQICDKEANPCCMEEFVRCVACGEAICQDHRERTEVGWRCWECYNAIY